MAGKYCEAAIGFLLRSFSNRRFFWICVIILSVWNMATIFMLMKNRSDTDSTTIGVTTSYISWINTFPAVSICLSKNRITKEFSEAVKRRSADGHSPSYTYIRTLYDYLFINPNNLYLKEEYCKEFNSTCGVDILGMRKELFASSCTEFIEKIYFSEKLLPNCEEIFKFHELEMGYCFLANNLIDYQSIEKMPLVYSSLDEFRNLRLVLRSGLIYRYDLYIHSPENQPYFNALAYTITSDPSVHSFNVEGIENNHDVIEEPVSQRMCKFDTETSDNNVLYSFSTCMSKIRSEIEMNLCNCTLFSQSKNSSINYCGVEGISCLDKGSGKYSSSSSDCSVKLYKILSGNLPARVIRHVGSNMACLPSCMEQQISYVGSREKNHNDYGDSNMVEIEITSPPTAKYFRTVTQTKLDLVVAVGGVIGLFTGASLLNILEVISIIFSKIKRTFTR
ncbi:acid-sensing ion channel 5 [Drosophila subobscura]|uniref:acid-sensing ion channel 5 n=1 Tax=Drosophila subobscura TaxID=7241 RepID=UPI00155A0FB8|nr:acid-sensing ion channel 5 [Drosophila subobscura]